MLEQFRFLRSVVYVDLLFDSCILGFVLVHAWLFIKYILGMNGHCLHQIDIPDWSNEWMLPYISGSLPLWVFPTFYILGMLQLISKSRSVEDARAIQISLINPVYRFPFWFLHSRICIGQYLIMYILCFLSIEDAQNEWMLPPSDLFTFTLKKGTGLEIHRCCH